MERTSQTRERFSTGMGAFVVTLGSAVGLGNIWKFPSETGTNGGAAFVIVYLVMTVLVGLPVMVAEHAIGRSTRSNAIGAFHKLAPGKLWWLIGAAGALSAFTIMAFYSEVAGWVFAYIFKAIGGGLATTDPAATGETFGALISNPGASLVWQWIALVWVCAIILMGVSKGIERVVKTLMPVLFCILIVTIVRSLTLDGAGEGLKYLFAPDFSKLTSGSVLTAMGLAFFKLSLGMGCMITYASYYPSDRNIPSNATRVMLADLLVSILAGLAVFPAVFAFGFQPDAGPSLLFITIPAVFAGMPGGRIFVSLFFVLAAVAATGAMLSLVEVPVAFMHEQWGWTRKRSTLVTFVLLLAFGATAALSNSAMANVTVFGLTFFDLFDFMSSKLLLPVGGFFISIYVGWVWGKAAFEKEVSNEGSLQNAGIIKALLVLLRFVSPLLILVVLLNGLGVF